MLTKLTQRVAARNMGMGAGMGRGGHANNPTFMFQVPFATRLLLQHSALGRWLHTSLAPSPARPMRTLVSLHMTSEGSPAH